MDSFKIISGLTLDPLQIREGIASFDREISFIKEVNKCFSNDLVYLQYGVERDLYTAKNIIQDFNNIYVVDVNSQPLETSSKIKICNLENINEIINNLDKKIIKVSSFITADLSNNLDSNVLMLIYDKPVDIKNFKTLKFYDSYVYVNVNVWIHFYKYFRYYIDANSNLKYDNLINLLIMVKNAGDSFRQVLIDNLPYIDRYTILDTGSTDNTIEIIKDVLKDKRGELYQEPFINFRDSRNRCIELAGKSCVFNIMLDDTYVLHGNLREFLECVRADDIADSYSIRIMGIDIVYTSNRIVKSSRNLKYKYTIHEIIETNLNVGIPVNDMPGLPNNLNSIYIEDRMSTYMQDRTNNRKLYDLDLLFKELEDDPNDPRTLYYLGETYLCLKDHKNAYIWYEKRSKSSGYSEEVQDSLYKMGVLAHYNLNYPWEFCEKLLLNCFEYDTNRPESLFVIIEHYMNVGNNVLAYQYAKKAYGKDPQLLNYNMNLKKDIYKYHIPKQTFELSYMFGDYNLSYDCLNQIINYRPEDNTAKGWLKILNLIVLNNQYRLTIKNKLKYQENKSTICFTVDGGWEKWDGETLDTKGLGGSETFIIKYCEYLAKFMPTYNIIIFCNCDNKKIYNNVTYIPITEYLKFISTYYIDICFINRYTELIPVTTINNIKTYCILHDLFREDEIVSFPNPQYFKGLLCISDWHKEYTNNSFPILKDTTSVVSYGIDIDSYNSLEKQKYSFIYSSFPGRGLYWLLKMFPAIVEKYPQAHLNIFCNTKHHFVQEHTKQMMDEIDIMLEQQKANVTNHGWVSGKILKEYWAKSHIWLYPCIFKETCCLTAYEAAASKTLAITNNLAALQQSVGDRGICIEGDPVNQEWRDAALQQVFKVFEDDTIANQQIQKNYDWVKTKQYDIVVNDFIEKYIK